MLDEIKVTGLEIKIDGKKRTLSIEKAWELKRELDKLLHTEPYPTPYPNPVPFLPYIPYVPYTEPYTYPTWCNGTDSADSFNVVNPSGNDVILNLSTTPHFPACDHPL